MMLLPVFTLVGLLIVAMAIPMVLRKVPPNGLYGLRVAEPELADSAPIVRHRKLAAIGWSQTAVRLVAYPERRTPWDS